MTSALPESFVRMLGELGLEDAAEAIAGTEPSVSLRLNPRKPPVEFEDATPVGWWAERGLTLKRRPSFTLDPALHQGRYYVQEAASMYHARVVSALIEAYGGRPLRVLDACAAPGGKTTAAIDALPDGSIVVANEIVPSRAAVLRENIIKWGFPSVIVTRGDTEALRGLHGDFDIIVADVPCSGEGMMRKDADAVAQWSPKLVAECASLQREIIENLWQTLRPGGYMVYSTCTFNRCENEQQILDFMEKTGAEPVNLPKDPSWGIIGAIGTELLDAARFVPGRTPTEGLFVTVLRKPGGSVSNEKVRKKPERKTQKRSAEIDEAARWIKETEGWTIVRSDDRITAVPAEAIGLICRLAKKTDIISEGVTIATVKGRDLIPTQALAMSTLLRRGAFPEAEFNREEALDYLRGNQPPLPEGLPKGYVLITYEGVPLGWVKNLGNRYNNLYPHPWRIKTK